MRAVRGMKDNVPPSGSGAKQQAPVRRLPTMKTMRITSLNPGRSIYRATLVVAVLTTALVVLCSLPLGENTMGRDLSRLKRALRAAALPEIGFPQPGWPNPYARVLKILNHDGNDIPAIWRARALSRYAVYLGSITPYGSGNSTWMSRKEAALLRLVVRICPKYANGWVRLALQGTWNAKSGQFLLRAYRADPANPYVEYLRAFEIWQQHSKGHPGLYTGNLGFTSRKWIRAFCYRGLMYLKTRKLRPDAPGIPALGGQSLWVAWIRPALGYYEPQQLAMLDAGRWKPGPCPDPWPPPERKSTTAPAGTRPAKADGGR